MGSPSPSLSPSLIFESIITVVYRCMKFFYIVLTVLAIASGRRTLAFVLCHESLGSRPLDSFFVSFTYLPENIAHIPEWSL